MRYIQTETETAWTIIFFMTNRLLPSENYLSKAFPLMKKMSYINPNLKFHTRTHCGRD